MSALLESIQTAFADQVVSKPALEQAIASGLPGPRSEQWKYTSLRALSARRFAAPTNTMIALDRETIQAIAVVPHPRVVFVNGVFDAGNSSHSDLPDGVRLDMTANGVANDADQFTGSHDIFVRLNAAIARNGVQLKVAEGSCNTVCLHIIFVSAQTPQDIAIHYSHKFELADNSRLSVFEHHISQGAQQNISNHRCEIVLRDNAQLIHVRLQQDAIGASHFLRSEAVLMANAQYRRVDLELGAHLSRHDLQVKLLGDGAALHANGSLIANGRRHVDTRLDIQHIAKNTACHLLWRGLASDRGRAVFHGGILIEQGADGAAAHLSNKNLLLSDNAEIDTQPVLVINADEVAASHGATVGRLDANHLFYLCARGIPEAQAKVILTTAFCKESLAVLENADLVDIIEPQLEKILQAIEV